MDFAQYFGGIAEGIGTKLAEKVTGRRLLAYHTARLGRELYAGEKPVVWANVSVPFELVNAFPVASTYSEFIGAVLAGAQIAPQYLEKAESAGFPLDGCSYHRALIGASLGGIVPEPIGVIAASCPCDGGLKTVAEVVGRMAGVPACFLNVPGRPTDEAVAYLAAQFEQMIEFLEERTGTKLDREKLAGIVGRSNRAAEILNDVYAFGRRTPVPYDHKDLKNFQIVMIPLMGTDEGIEIAEAFRDEFAARIENGYAKGESEKLRLLWVQNRVQFPNDLLDHIDAAYGARIVWDELNEVYWDPIDPEDPLPGLARRLIDNPLGGNVDRRTEVIVKRCCDYGIQGAIHPSNWGCRQSQNARGLFAEALKAIDVPMITLDMDCVDPRQFHRGQLLTRLEAFCEMLAG